MADRQSQTDEPPSTQPSATDRLVRQALDQVREEARDYDAAVRSYNGHLDNHRHRRDLHDIPPRRRLTPHDAFQDAMSGDRAAIDRLLTHLLDQAHLDSQLRRHPRPYPIHLEACEHLQVARSHVVSTLEDALRHMDEAA